MKTFFITEDRYSGAYSGAQWLAFNMRESESKELDYDAGDQACQKFWATEANKYQIGRGNTPQAAFDDLIKQIIYGKCCELIDNGWS